MTSFGLRLSEATQLHNGAWVAALLGPLLGVKNRKNELNGLNIVCLFRRAILNICLESVTFITCNQRINFDIRKNNKIK